MNEEILKALKELKEELFSINTSMSLNEIFFNLGASKACFNRLESEIEKLDDKKSKNSNSDKVQS